MSVNVEAFIVEWDEFLRKIREPGTCTLILLSSLDAEESWLTLAADFLGDDDEGSWDVAVEASYFYDALRAHLPADRLAAWDKTMNAVFFGGSWTDGDRTTWVEYLKRIGVGDRTDIERAFSPEIIPGILEQWESMNPKELETAIGQLQPPNESSGWGRDIMDYPTYLAYVLRWVNSLREAASCEKSGLVVVPLC